MAAVVLRAIEPSGNVFARPFLKWAGGKRQLLPELLGAVGRLDAYKAYHEPFVGGGALFFAMSNRGLLNARARLSEVNEKLVETYLAVRDEPEKLIELLSAHAERHGDEYYYRVRAHVPHSRLERAARLIYLNKSCYNGLFRENSRGEFNVPVGRYKNPCICDASNIRACSLSLRNAEIESRPFESILSKAQKGDLVYLDPPYHPLSKTASFTAYSRDGFDERAQRKLAEVFAELAEKRVFVLLSNSDTPLMRSLYETKFRVTTVKATRNVNSCATKRGHVAELLISNF